MSDDSDDEPEMVQVSHLIPEDVKEDAKENAGHGDLSDAVREAYRIIAYGDDYEDTFRLKQRLERARNEYERLVEDKEQIEREMRDVKDRIDTLEAKLETAEAEDEEYSKRLDGLEASLRSGEHLFPDHGMVEEAAEVGSVSPQAVIEELRERNSDVPDDAFVKKSEAEFRWDGVED